MKLIGWIAAIAAACALSCPPAFAEDVAGKWVGVLKLPAPIGETHVGVRLRKSADGSWSGAWNNPDQGGRNLAVADVKADAETLSLSAPARASHFEGRWDPAKQAWVGTWSAATVSAPLELTRGSIPPAQTGPGPGRLADRLQPDRRDLLASRDGPDDQLDPEADERDGAVDPRLEQARQLFSRHSPGLTACPSMRKPGRSVTSTKSCECVAKVLASTTSARSRASLHAELRHSQALAHIGLLEAELQPAALEVLADARESTSWTLPSDVRL